MINFDFLSAKLISEPLHAVIWLIAEFEYLPNHLQCSVFRVFPVTEV